MHTYTIKRKYDKEKEKWVFWVEDENGKRIGIPTHSFEQARRNQKYLQKYCPGI